jgi:hypothetical protein
VDVRFIAYNKNPDDVTSRMVPSRGTTAVISKSKMVRVTTGKQGYVQDLPAPFSLSSRLNVTFCCRAHLELPLASVQDWKRFSAREGLTRGQPPTWAGKSGCFGEDRDGQSPRSPLLRSPRLALIEHLETWKQSWLE